MKYCVVVVAAALGVLATLGLLVSGVVAPTIGNDSLWCLKRQSVALGIGLVAAVFAARIPWRLWLKAAPWLFAIWAVLFCVSFAFAPVNGECRYVFFGPITIDTWTLGWLVAGLFVAWLRTKVVFGWRWLLMVLVVGLSLATFVQIATNENRLIRAKEFFGLTEPAAAAALPVDCRAAEQEFLYEAYRTSKWIGRNKNLAGKFVPNGHKSGVSSGTAVAFGKAFPIGVLMLFAVVSMALVSIGRYMANASGRLFLLIYGLWLCVPAAYNFAECNKLVPCLGLGIPLVSYGMSAMLVACVGFGVVWTLATSPSLSEHIGCADSRCP